VLRIGIVGAGLIAWTHAIGIQAMVGAGVIDAAVGAVFDVDAGRAAALAARSGARPAGGVGEVLDACDAVWVCTPTAAHREVVEQGARHGTAVFCEKPLAPDLAGAEALVAAVAAAGVPSQVGLVLRSTPLFSALRLLVATGELGRPMAAVLRDDQYFPIQGLYGSTWRADVEVAGGGCLIEHSIHDLDILRYCLGEVVEVAGRTENYAGHPGVEDVATVSLGFESGASAELVSVWHGILSRGSSRRMELFCEQGMAWFDDEFGGILHVETSDGVEARTCAPSGWLEGLRLGDDRTGSVLRSYTEADRAFVEAVTNGRPPEPGLAEALAAHRVVDAAYRSAAAGGDRLRRDGDGRYRFR
jgi:myo-inositol 2-dehydrogenase / D-chiro-inositol 1-dehydrogenase